MKTITLRKAEEPFIHITKGQVEASGDFEELVALLGAAALALHDDLGGAVVPVLISALLQAYVDLAPRGDRDDD